MTPVWLPPEIAGQFLFPRIDAPRGIGPFEAVGVLNGDMSLVAVIAIHDWQPERRTCQISAAADDARWATRGVIRFVLDHVFGAKECEVAIALTEAGNDRVRRLWAALGAVETIVPHGRGKGCPEIALTLTDDAWATSRLNRRLADG